MLCLDEEESGVLPKGSPEIAEIRKIIKRAKRKMVMVKEKNTFKLPAWVEIEDEKPKINKTTMNKANKNPNPQKNGIRWKYNTMQG